MNVNRRALVLPLLALALLTGCTSAGTTPAADAPLPTPSQLTLPAPQSAPAPGASLAGPVRPGEVRLEPGPFTDRVKLERLTLDKGSAVGGHLTITSDISDVLALELRAAFYDQQGQLAGTGTFHYQEEESEGAHLGPRAAEGGIDFSIPAEKLTSSPVTAVLSLPVLVNE
ncbi:hypothetical protein ACIRBX_09955 [Kitasatospora sp. NPDC096147]|uniref:hypothetical protein n=1 Tax=Kitasatospora sp. NPDC096147 TaxID=3364093 RepID=UPI003822B582